jgi:hypothetical protein
MIRSIGVTTIALALWAAPVAAQETEAPADTTMVEEAAVAAEETAQAVEEAAEETADVAEEAAEDVADVAQEAGEATAEAAGEAIEEPVESHDWEFALSATDRAPGATAEVRVTEGDPENSFVLEVSGLPAVDDLDEENRDVNAYTVWIVPAKDRVPESTLAGVLNVAPETGQGTFEASTSLDTFGVIESATADGAPASIGGVPVLTGIPVSPEPATEPEPVAEAEAPAAEGETAAEPEAPAAETPGEESGTPPPAEEAPVEEAPAEEAPAPPAPETPGQTGR